MPAVYIHIPFCKQKCSYCDFNSYAGLGSVHAAYVDALVADIEHQAARLSATQAGLDVGTVFIGGGTPTLLEPAHIEKILRALGRSFSISTDAEISIEANPETVTLENMRHLKSIGVNRVSIGFQSLDDEFLKLLGRKHSAEQAVDAFSAARAAGFDNINVDLISGIPGQSLASWALTLEQVAALGPEHISCYSLIIEPNTAFEHLISTGKLQSPDEDAQGDMFSYTVESLIESGYEHYEISNFAHPGKRCKHNLVYWNNLDYIGFGAGAHSKIADKRFSNLVKPDDYMRAADTDSCIAEVLELSHSDEVSETLFLGLRLIDGISLEGFESRFGCPVEEIYGPQVDKLVEEGLLARRNGQLKLTSRGVLLGNEVFSRFV